MENFKKGRVIKAQAGSNTNDWYSELIDFDPSGYTHQYDTSRLVNADMFDDNWDAWTSDVTGIGQGRYKPASGNTRDYTQGIEDTQYYQNFGKALFSDGKFTDLGLAWAKATDALLPKGSKATFLDENNNRRTSWTADNKDIYDRAPNTFSDLVKYANYVRNDQILGARHNVFLNTGKRYFYKDKNGNKHWVDPNVIDKYVVSDTPESSWNDDHTVYWNDYELTGLKTPEESVVETPQDKKQSSINPISQPPSTKSTNQLGNFMSQLAPDLIGARRLFGSLRTNNKVAETIRRSLTPVLKNTHELYSPVTGAFSEMQLRNSQAADIRRQAARPFTSDASLQLAGALEANRQATDLERQGFLADDAEIKRTKAEALRRQEDNIARRSEVANFNRASINQTNRELAQLEGTRLKQNWQSVDNFLSGLEGRVRQRAEVDRERRLNFGLQTAQQDIDDQYYDALQKAQDAALKWQKDPANASKTLSEMPNYFQFLRELSRWRNANSIGAHANVYGYRYDNKYLNKSARDIGSKYRFYKNGGGFESLFTTYVPAQSPQQTRSVQTSQSEKSSRQDSDDKGKLTEKELFNMLKDINGLPNERHSIVTNLIDTLNVNKIAGMELSDLATIYLENLYKIRQANNNQKQYDEVEKRAIEKGSMTEPAITVDGKLVIQNKDGNIQKVSLKDFINNRGQYGAVLTVSNLLHMRAYSPSFINDSSIFDTVDNSIGYQFFQELIKGEVNRLGYTQISREGMFSAEGQASKGLELLKTLKESDQIQAMGSVTAEGLYKYKVIDKNQLSQINALTSYMVTMLPDNIKTWAAFKLQNPNKNEATKNLILQYLLSGNIEQHSFDIDYNGSMEKVTGDKKESNKNNKAVSDTIDMNTAMKWLAGFGTYDIFTINPGTNNATQVLSNTMPLTDSDKKYLGANSVLQQASQGEYAGILDFNNTSMGMQKIDPVNFGKVVLTDGKISSIDYPSKVLDDGTIVPDLSPQTSQAKLNADREIKQLGINLSDQDSIQRNYQQINNIYQKHKLQPAYNPDGTPTNNWHRFGVINASASNSTLGLGVMDNNELLQIIQDDAIVDNLLQITQEENYDKNEWYNPADWGGNYDHFYRGTVWIPVKTSYIAASANNSMKVNEVMDISQREQALNASNILTKEKK